MTEQQWLSMSSAMGWSEILLLGGIVVIVIILGFFAYLYLKSNAFLQIQFKALGRFEDLAEANKKLREAEDQTKSLQKAQADLKNKIEELESQEVAKKHIQAELNTVTQEYDIKRKEYDELQVKLTKDKAVQEFIEEHKTEQIDQLDNLIAEKQKQLNELAEEHTKKLQSDKINEALTEVFKDISASDKAEQAEKTLKEKQKQLADLNQQLEQTQSEIDSSKINEKLSESLQEVFDDLCNQVNTAATQATLASANAELKSTQDELDELKDKLAQAKVQDTLNDALSDVFNDLSAQRDADAAQDQLEDTRADIEQATSELKDLQHQIKEAQSQLSREAVSSELTDALGDVVEKLQTQAATNNALNELDEVNADIAAAQEELKGLQNQIKSATAKLSDNMVTESITAALNNAFAGLQNSLNKSLANMGDQLSSLAKLTNETSNLESKRNALHDEIAKLNEARTGKPSDEDKKAAYIELDNVPQAINDFRDKTIQAPYQGTEEQALSDFQQFLLHRKFYYSPRTIKAFHTSLKVQHINPISVLAGLSGTGKTQLALHYAEFFGFYREIVPVQPRWDSKDDLLGFYNFLEKRYQPTELVKALYHFYQFHCTAKKGNSFNPMMMVVLDEMNLARVEYYFSEFLSKLELRLKEHDMSKISIGTQLNSREFFVERNVVLVGTMNDDESTYSLSDKVLDRSNVLHFGKPADRDDDSIDLAIKSKTEPKNIYVDANTFGQWCSVDNYNIDDNGALKDEVSQTIKQLNKALDKVGKAFGYRVENSISEYVKLYPGIASDPTKAKLALADQIEMKVIPKLAGLEKNEKSDDCLNSIEHVINYTNDTELISDFRAARQSYEDYGMFIWRGVSRSVTANNQGV